MTEITFLKKAEEELNYTAQYYNQESSGLGFDFLEEIENSLKNIKQAPERWLVYEGNIRKYNVKRFPFSLYYVFEKEKEKIIIVAVAHQKRKPGYWRKRF